MCSPKIIAIFCSVILSTQVRDSDRPVPQIRFLSVSNVTLPIGDKISVVHGGKVTTIRASTTILFTQILNSILWFVVLKSFHWSLSTVLLISDDFCASRPSDFCRVSVSIDVYLHYLNIITIITQMISKCHQQRQKYDVVPSKSLVWLSWQTSCRHCSPQCPRLPLKKLYPLKNFWHLSLFIRGGF